MENKLNKKHYYVYQKIINILYPAIFNVKVYNKEFIPQTGNAIIIGNHVNNLDPCNVIISTKRMVSFLAKSELFEPWYGFVFRNAKCISVDCDHKSHESTVEAIRRLNMGELVGLFPEGAVKRDDSIVLQPFKNGAIKMAKETNSPIIPFAIVGKYKAFTGKLKVIFSEPIDISEMSYEEANKLLYDKIYNLIIENENKDA